MTATQLSPSNTLPDRALVEAALIQQQAAEADIEAVLWLLDFADRRGLTTHGQVGQLIGKHASVVNKVLRGNYPALHKITEAINTYRSGGHRPILADGWPFVADLRINTDIAKFCDLARKARTMALLWGPNQSGKSAALNYYASIERTERTFYVSMPDGGGTKMFMHALATAIGVSPRKSVEELRNIFLSFFVSDDLLIIDEMHQTMIGRTLKTTTIERIRTLWDHAHCGVLLCGTDTFKSRMDDPRFRDFLGQTDNRAGALKRRIPPEPYKRDIARLAHAYGYPPIEPGEAMDEIERLRPHGLGRIAKIMQMATFLANNDKTDKGTVTWDHFVRTIKTGRMWEKGEPRRDGDNYTLSED